MTQDLQKTEGTAGRRLLIVGAGGHAKVVIEAAQSAGWEPVAAFDPGPTSDVLSIRVLGTDEDIAPYWASGAADGAVIAIGDNDLRHHLANKVRKLGCPTPPIIHSSAWVSPSATISEGVVIMAGAMINANAKINRDCIVNTSAIIEHDCILEEAVHAAPRTVMGGVCRLGKGVLFGIGATARPGIEIGAHAIVGAGSVVVSNVADNITVVGNPARPLKKI